MKDLIKRADDWLAGNDHPSRAIFHIGHTAKLIRDLRQAVIDLEVSTIYQKWLSAMNRIDELEGRNSAPNRSKEK